MAEKLDESKWVIYKDEENTVSQLGVDRNRIVEIPNFVDPETAANMIKYFETKAEYWGPIAFYGSSGMGIKDEDPDLAVCGLYDGFFPEIRERYREALTQVFDREVKCNTSHAQKWDVGGHATPHSDNSAFDGTPTSFEINKYVAILYLNDDYTGGELFFRDHDIKFKPNAYSLITFPGGVENVHGVHPVKSGTRYTMVSFWDFADATYSEERQAWWAEEEARIKIEQEKQREEWARGIF